jgi:hypothetical protein
MKEVSSSVQKIETVWCIIVTYATTLIWLNSMDFYVILNVRDEIPTSVADNVIVRCRGSRVA